MFKALNEYRLMMFFLVACTRLKWSWSKAKTAKATQRKTANKTHTHTTAIYIYICIHLIGIYFPLFYLFILCCISLSHTYITHSFTFFSACFFRTPSIKAVMSKNCKACCQHVTSAQLDAKAEKENKVRWRLWWPISWPTSWCDPKWKIGLDRNWDLKKVKMEGGNKSHCWFGRGGMGIDLVLKVTINLAFSCIFCVKYSQSKK